MIFTKIIRGFISPERASEAGKKGGKNSHGGGRKSGDS
ncbi:general stress protein [Klebsiella pneumoniae]|nr:KGG domain-containing protein [Klebsiella pneumoniae]